MCIRLSGWTRRSQRPRSHSRQERYTNSRSTQTAMQLPILVTACSSRLREMGSRARQCAVFKVNELPAWATRAKLSSSKHRSQSGGQLWLRKTAITGGEPTNDDRFSGVFAHELEHAGGYTPEDAVSVARKLLPDILSYDPRGPVRFPHNGRTLTDDVVDVFF